MSYMLVISIVFCLLLWFVFPKQNSDFNLFLSGILLSFVLVMKVVVPVIHDLQEQTNSLLDKIKEMEDLHIQKLPD